MLTNANEGLNFVPGNIRNVFTGASKIPNESFLGVKEGFKEPKDGALRLFKSINMAKSILEVASEVAEFLDPNLGTKAAIAGMKLFADSALPYVLKDGLKDGKEFLDGKAIEKKLVEMASEIDAKTPFPPTFESLPFLQNAAACVDESLSDSDVKWENQKLKDSLMMINVHLALILILKDYIIVRKESFTKRSDYILWLYNLLFEKSLEEYIKDDIIDSNCIKVIIDQYGMKVPIEYDTSKRDMCGRITASGLSHVIQQFGVAYCREEVNMIKLLGQVNKILSINYVDFLDFSMDKFYLLPGNERLNEARRNYTQDNLVDPFFVFFLVFRKKRYSQLLISPLDYPALEVFKRSKLYATKDAISGHTSKLLEISNHINSLMIKTNEFQWSIFIRSFIEETIGDKSIVISRNMNNSDRAKIKDIVESSETINFSNLPNALTLHITIILIFEIFDLGNGFGGNCRMVREIENKDPEGFVKKINQSNFRFSLSIKGLFVVGEELDIDEEKYRGFISKSRAKKVVAALRTKIHNEIVNFEDFPAIIKTHCYFLEAFNVIPLLAVSEKNLQSWDGTSFYELMVVQLNEFTPYRYNNIEKREVTDSFIDTFNRLVEDDRKENGEYRWPYHDSFDLIFMTILPWVRPYLPTSPKFRDFFRQIIG